MWQKQKIEQVLYGRIPGFPGIPLTGQKVYVDGSVNFFRDVPPMSKEARQEMEMRQRRSNLILALNDYIRIRQEEKNSKPTDTKTKIEAAQQIISEVEKISSLEGLFDFPDLGNLKEKIGRGRLYDILHAHVPEVFNGVRCVLM